MRSIPSLPYPKQVSHRPCKRSLQLVLVVPFVLQILGAVGLTGYLSFRNGQRAIDNLTTTLVNRRGDRIKDRLEAYLTAPQIANQINLNAIQSNEVNPQNFGQLQNHFWRQQRIFTSVTANYYGSAQGEFLAVGCLNGMPTLSVLKASDRRIRRNYLLDSQGKQGKLVGQVPNYDPRQRPWYKAAAQAGKATWSPIFPYIFLPAAVGISATTPLYGPTGQLTGVLSTELQLTELSTFLHKFKVSPSGQTFILERSGDLVATSTLEQPFTVGADRRAKGRLQAVNSRDPLTRETAQYLTRYFGKFTNIQMTRTLRFGKGEQRKLLRVTPYRDKYGLDWIVVVVVPESDFMDQINAHTKTTVLLCIAALSIAVVLGVLTARFITEPLLELNRAAREIANGNLDQTVNVGRSDEIGELSQSFNRMVRQLQDYNDNLEAQVVQRTAELAQTNAQLQQEIIDRQEAQSALDKSRYFIERIADHSPQVLYVLNVETWSNEYVNRQSINILGYNPEEIQQQGAQFFLSTIHPEDALLIQQNAQHWATALDGDVLVTEYRMRHRDGSWRWLCSHDVVFARDTNHRVTKIIGTAHDITDRKQAELALQEREAMLRAIGDNIHKGMIYQLVCEPNGYVYFSYVSAGVEQLTGLKPEAILQDASVLHNLILEEDKLLNEQLTLESMRNLSVFEMQMRKQTLQNTIRWSSVRSTPRRLADGSTVWDGVEVDITDLKQAEAALQESEAHYRAIVEDQTELVARFTPQGILTFVNEAFCRYFQQSREDLLGHEFQPLIFEEDLEHVLHDINSLTLEEQGTTIENRVVVGGGVRWTQWNNRKIFDGQGRFVELQSVGRDITDRKQAELELIQNRDLKESIFNESTDALFLVNPSTLLIMDCNLRAAELFEASKHELINTSGIVLHKQPFTTDELAMLTQEIREFGFASREIEYLTKKGNSFWGNLAVKNITIGGQVAQLVRVTDITKRYLLDRMKDEFLSVVSHELRTPLTTIHGALNLLSEGLIAPQSERGQRMIQIAAAGADRLVRLVNDILDLERLESSKVPLEKHLFNAADLMTRANEFMQLLATHAGISLLVSPVSIVLDVDGDRIIQVLTNLLSNAIKFSPSDSTISLTAEVIAAETHAAPCSCLQFAVQDSGRGIPIDNLETIFERFHQVDASDSRQKGGTGLGLAICQSIIQQHGGKIWVESTLNQGSCFYFTLPIADNDKPSDTPT